MAEYAVLNDILDSIGPLDAGWMKKAAEAYYPIRPQAGKAKTIQRTDNKPWNWHICFWRPIFWT